ncbi:hypothetical protein [Pseudomonas sp. NGC7]|uniref:hypothetical protein n=1 Tax=Pseudomonas sp. NGC7 TaxID=3341775 RepID=UPI0037DA8A47
MSTNSKASLLKWLETGDRLLGNDSVFAIDKAKADRLLTQEYIRRFKTNSYLPPVNGETQADNGYKVFMQNFILDHPRLSFDNTDITSSRASLRMKIVGGNQVGLKQAGANWYPQRIDRIEPLVGPELRLNLQLSEVPGHVDDGGALTLDLRNSDDFVMMFSDSRRIRELGGDFFKALFRALPDEKRVWSLGHIEHGDDDLLRPESFQLYTQRNPSVTSSPMDIEGDADTDGALLGTIRMVGGRSEQDSTPGKDYRYLIPGDSSEYSAAVMFGKNRVALATILRNIPRTLFEAAEFNVVYANDGGVTATATGGQLKFSGGADSAFLEGGYADVGYGWFFSEMNMRVPAGTMPLAGNLKIHIAKGQVVLEFDNTAWRDVEVTRYWDSWGYADPWNPGTHPSFMLGGWSAESRLIFKITWKIDDQQGGRLQLSGIDIDFPNNWDLINLKRKGPVPPAEGNQFPTSVQHGIWMRGCVYDAVINVARGTSIPQLRAALAKDLATDLYMNEVVEKTIQLNFGGAIAGRDLYLPRDVVSFGSVNPKLTTFTVSPLEKVMVQGDKLQLSVVPAQQKIEWSVESVEGSADDAGNFDRVTNGLYLAPGASGIRGDFTRVRITATAPATGFSSSALVTVVKNALSVSPLVELCQVGDEGVTLKAGHVSEGELNWRILGAQPHGSLAHASGATNTYMPGPNLQGKSFVVEEVEVSNSVSGERRSLCIITQMTQTRPSDVLVDKRDASLGRVWLSISAGGNVGVSELTVLHGPGTVGIDGEGKPYYQSVGSSTAPFCVVRAYWEPMPGFPFTFDGFIVLPLPLGEHIAAYQTLEQAAERATRR